MDGAGEFYIFVFLVFRLIMPAFTTVLVLAFVASWNNYFLPLVVLNSSEHFPVTVGLAQWYAAATAGSGGEVLFTVVAAGSLVSIIPGHRASSSSSASGRAAWVRAGSRHDRNSLLSGRR